MKETEKEQELRSIIMSLENDLLEARLNNTANLKTIDAQKSHAELQSKHLEAARKELEVIRSNETPLLEQIIKFDRTIKNLQKELKEEKENKIVTQYDLMQIRNKLFKKLPIGKMSKHQYDIAVAVRDFLSQLDSFIDKTP